MNKPLHEIQKIHQDAGLPVPRPLGRMVMMVPPEKLAAHVPERPQDTATIEPPEHENPNPPHSTDTLIEAQIETAERSADEILAMVEHTLDTRKDIDKLLGQANTASYIIDWAIDPIAGFVPVIGDSVGSLAGIYIIQKAREAGVPKEQIRKMVINLALDFGIGLIPGVGDFLDLFFRANKRNVQIFRQYADNVKTDKYRPKF